MKVEKQCRVGRDHSHFKKMLKLKESVFLISNDKYKLGVVLSRLAQIKCYFESIDDKVHNDFIILKDNLIFNLQG